MLLQHSWSWQYKQLPRPPPLQEVVYATISDVAIACICHAMILLQKRLLPRQSCRGNRIICLIILIVARDHTLLQRQSKFALACKIIPKGLRFRFQFIGMVCQQSRLNVHSKKRWNLSLHNLNYKVRSCNPPYPCFSFSRDSLYPIYPWGVDKRRNLCFPRLLEAHNDLNKGEAAVIPIKVL